MQNLTYYLVPVALVAVAVVLLLGIWTMLRGKNPGLSQTLMRWRVGLQLVAVVVILAALYYSNA
ncbi:MAG: twin transmembrane helix small protein [Hyphomicrobiales bacterium]